MSLPPTFPQQRREQVHPLAMIPVLLAASISAAAAETQRCIPTFSFKQGWWGADGAYSIPFPDGRTVWIFGDTAYGKDRFVEGNNPRMVRNSIGVSTCDGAGNWNIDYVNGRVGVTRRRISVPTRHTSQRPRQTGTLDGRKSNRPDP